MRGKKSLKPLLKTCPGRDSGTSAEEGSADEEDICSKVENPSMDELFVAQSDVAPTKLNKDSSASPEHSLRGFSKAGSLEQSESRPSAIIREIDRGANDFTGEISRNFSSQSSEKSDRFSLKTNFIQMKNRNKSKKRKLGPAAEDGRTQKSINSYFGRVAKKDEPETDRPASTSSSVSSFPEKVGPGSFSQSITISTLDGFVSSSPRKLSTSGSITDTADYSRARAQPAAKRKKFLNDLSGPPVPKSIRVTSSQDVPVSPSSSSWEAGILDLPDEILETIFCQIPHNG